MIHITLSKDSKKIKIMVAILFFLNLMFIKLRENGGSLMDEINDLEVKLRTKHLPFDYKWLEFRLIVNKELYDEDVIDLKTFKAMEQSLISRLTKIKNEYSMLDVK